MRELRFYRRRLARFAAATRAATAVEFALIAPFFLGILRERLGAAINALSAAHRTFLAVGGLGLPIDDGADPS